MPARATNRTLAFWPRYPRTKGNVGGVVTLAVCGGHSRPPQMPLRSCLARPPKARIHPAPSTIIGNHHTSPFVRKRIKLRGRAVQRSRSRSDHSQFLRRAPCVMPVIIQRAPFPHMLHETHEILTCSHIIRLHLSVSFRGGLFHQLNIASYHIRAAMSMYSPKLFSSTSSAL